MSRYLKPSVVAVILLFLISGYALFCEPLIGLADNGDFFRVMAPNDLKHEQDRDINDYFGYFNVKYDKMQYYNELEGKIQSTHNIVLRTAMAIDDLFTNDKKFDIRFQALLCLMILALGIYYMVESAESMTENKILKLLLAFLAVFIFGDIGYTSYFNSFYGEAIAYPFFILSIGALLRFTLREEAKIRYLLVFALSTIMFIGSKNQYSLNGVIAFALLLALLFFKIRDYKKIISAALAVVLLVSTFVLYTIIDDNIQSINKYHMITRGTMLFEPDVQQITEKLGLNEEYSLLAGTIYFDRTPVIDPKNELLTDGFYSKYDLASIAIYYFTNPNAFTKMMELGWKNSFTVRPEVLGNYTRSSGKGFGERTSFFSVWSYFKDNCIPHYSGLIYIFLAACAALSVSRIIKNRKEGRHRIYHYFEVVMLYVFLTGFSQILVSFIGAGDTDLKKHLFMTTVSIDVLLYFSLAYGASLFLKSRQKTH